MKRTFLGEFEEIVLLVVAGGTDAAYGVIIWENIQKSTGQSISLSAVHATLYRLEEKEFLSSEMGGATAERGGRRKRFFKITNRGNRALPEIQELRQQLWKAIPTDRMQPKLSFDLSSFQPVKVLKGTFKAGRYAAIPRQTLVVLQFTVSIILIIGTIVVFRQIQFAKNRPVDYSREGLTTVYLWTPEIHTLQN